jgi:hypothetical protein
MGKGGDLIGRSGGAGFNKAPMGDQPIPLANPGGKPKDPKHPKFEPPRDAKAPKGSGPSGGAPSSVRPKV